MPEGSYTALRDDGGGYAIILDRMVLDHLKATRAPGESYSDVILRLAKSEGARRGAGQNKSRGARERRG
jgi:hypothetical protein